MKLFPFVLLLLIPLAFAVPPKVPVRPAADAVPAAVADLDPGVKLRIETFFKLLREERTDAAYAKLFEGSTLAAEQPELLPALVKNTEGVLEKCGKMETASLLRVRSAGKTLKEVICIASCQKRPIRWQIYAYYAEGRWQILDTDVDLELSSFFDPEPSASDR